MLILRLLILITICCGVIFATKAQQPAVKSSARDTLDTLKRLSDTLSPVKNSIRSSSDTSRPVPDTLNPRDTLKSTDTASHADTLKPVSDTVRHIDTLRHTDSLTSKPPSDTTRPSFDSLKRAYEKENLLTGDTTLQKGLNQGVNPRSLWPVQPGPAASGAQPRSAPGSSSVLSPALTPGAPGLPNPTGLSNNPAGPSGHPNAATVTTSGNHAPGAGPGRRYPGAGIRTAASLSNLHRKSIVVRSGVMHIDSLSLVPGAFYIKDVPDSAYSLDWVNATLTWKRLPPGLDSVWVVYRVFPYKLNAVAKRFTYDSIQNNFLAKPYVFNNGYRNGNDDFFSFGNINYNGSFGRAITFGNSQDAVVTSNLNLQISGYLADSIEISAAITDNNIPIQPDGTTADLNEFDKIFLQFKKKGWALSLGDIDLRQNQNYFLNFYKRMQGASFETTNQITPDITNKTLVSGAIAKGKFTRNIFQGREGNQGPYKLQGANNELYFIVLAGTEKVYIDGQQMQRGEDQDYVINYNTGEVTFTANRMITQDARIQVEFEYADRNYLNVNLYLFNELKIKDKFKLRVGLFSNSDSRNSPINQTLTPDQNKFLNRLGDSISHAYYPVANVDTFAVGKILYKKIDTIYKNAAGVEAHDSVYVFSSDPANTLYNLSFANVGIGFGNYIPDLNGVNGNVFQWVAPVNGKMQGSYEAAQFLVTPKTQRILTMGADYNLNKNTVVNADVAQSHYDVNTLSSLDKGNDDGYAAKFQIRNTHAIGASAKGWQLGSNLGYEYVQQNFRPLERLRPVEFNRDWGLALTVAQAEEKIYTAGLQLSDKKLNSIRYDIARYERGDGFTGTRNILTHKQEIKGWRISDQLSYTMSDSTGFKGYYIRPSIDLSKRFPKLKGYLVGAGYSLERNEGRDKKTDTVTSTSFAFQTFQAYLKSPEKDPNHWGLTLTTRTNAYPYGGSLIRGDVSKTANLFAEFLKNPHHQFRITATYRNLQILNTRLTNQTADNSLLSRVEYIVNEWKGLLRGNLLYEIGSGQEQKKNYTYLKVPAGTGQYTWIDANKDGIQQLNEFVLAQFQDQAQYIRVFTPTAEYVKANYNTLNYSLTINPKTLINPVKSGSFARLLARIILQSSMQLSQKELAKGFIQFNPFKAPFDDTSLITRSLIVVNTLSFNRSDPHWGFDVSNTRNNVKTLLTYGYEARQLNEWTIRSRINVTRSVALNATFRQGANQLFQSGSNFDSSNYNLRQVSFEPDLTYTRGGNFRVGVGYKLSAKMNKPELGGQKYTSGAFNTDFKYNIVQSTSIQAKFTYSDITYLVKGGGAGTGSSISYVMLEGLSPGKNYLWNMDLTKKLGNSLEISLQYEGRKAGEVNIVHTGRASLRALL